MNPGDIALVAAGAGIGGGLRFALGTWMAERWGTTFPWHTLVINVSGSFLLGLLMALSIDRGAISPGWRLFLGVGVLGGYTTLSTLSYESVALIERGLTASGLLNIAATALIGLFAAWLGIVAGRAL